MLLIMAGILSFFVTPLGDYSKLQLNRLFASTPTIIPVENGKQLPHYNWKLKDATWNFFNFNRSKEKVVFINFWASWHLPSRAQFKDIEQLYEKYNGQVEFYLITNEERQPVEAFLEKNEYTLPITYQIIGEPSPVVLLQPPGSYVIDKKGVIRVHQTDISDWQNGTIDKLLETLISE